MSAAERQQILSDIGSVLEDDVHGELMTFFAAAVALNEKHPEQVNNEIRNAFTHFARAISVGTLADAREEMRKGRTHIERAKRDALKLAVIAIKERIAGLCSEIKLLHGTINPAFVVRRNELTAKRRQLLREEISGDPAFLANFVKLYNDADQLELELLGEFNIVQACSSTWKRWLVHARRQAVGALFGIAVGVIGSLVFSIIFPDAETPGQFVRNIFERSETVPLASE